MSNAVAISETPRRSLLADMAARYGMEPKAFADTLRATVVPPKASNEEFAAFLMVAREYSLNPITKEIYAFPKQGGGIQPIVSVDGWANLINSHPQCDGFEFEDKLDNDKGDLVSVTCRIYRKDRSRHTSATEYMVECRRDTSTWRQWPRRMLRHKALIQAARYAFGFAGIVDPDEAERFTAAPQQMRVVPREEPPAPPPLIEAPRTVPEASADAPKTDPAPQAPPPTAIAPSAAPHPNEDPEGFVRFVLARFAQAKDVDALIAAWDAHVEPVKSALFPPDEEDLMSAFRKREHELA